MLRHVRKGDTVTCHSMDRMARNLEDLRALVSGMTRRGVQVRFVKEGLTFCGDDSPMANLMLNLMGSFAEFERQLLKERQREGIALAKERGAYHGRQRSLSLEQVAVVRERVNRGEPKAAVARHFGVSRETLYAYLRSTNASEAA